MASPSHNDLESNGGRNVIKNNTELLRKHKREATSLI
jgi:hypothetical protein